MTIFNVLSLLGGLAMFLYGMRIMGDGLKESSSGTLKRVMEKVTNNPVKAFLLGLAVTAIIQSSTATIVITSGLVGAGIISLHQSIGIIVGANVGTTVTGQIIRLLDVDSSGTKWLEFLKPSTLAPVALIIGIILILSFGAKKQATVGKIAVGFGLLFSGLLNMTDAVDVLSTSGVFESIFSSFSSNPFLGYLSGAGVAFVLQSSSATIGILQALSQSGQLAFKAVYAIIVGVYLGDCVTTAIVCSIGAKPDARRVGMVNILFNFGKTILVLAGVTVAHKLGALDKLWDMTVRSGEIANTNSIFNIACSILLFPLLPVFEKLSRKIIKSKEEPSNPYTEKLNALSPAFFKSPALALRSCYDVLMSMVTSACRSIEKSLNLLDEYKEEEFQAIEKEESNIDMLADRVSNYMIQLSAHLSEENHVAILDQYYKMVTEFERLGDHAVNIAETAADLHERKATFTKDAMRELRVVRELTHQILTTATHAFEKRDMNAAVRIEPMEEVVDDLVNEMRTNHLDRLRKGRCTAEVGSDYLDLLSDLERISDICSNVGIAVALRVHPELGDTHAYISSLHSGKDESFNQSYNEIRRSYFGLLEAVSANKEE